MSEFISIAQPRLTHEAHLIRTRLEADGITVFLRGEKIASMVGVPNEFNTDWSNPLGGVSVIVPLHQADRARLILREIKETPDEDEAESLKNIRPSRAAQFMRVVLACSAVWMIIGVAGSPDKWTLLIIAALFGLIFIAQHCVKKLFKPARQIPYNESNPYHH